MMTHRLFSPGFCKPARLRFGNHWTHKCAFAFITTASCWLCSSNGHLSVAAKFSQYHNTVSPSWSLQILKLKWLNSAFLLIASRGRLLRKLLLTSCNLKETVFFWFYELSICKQHYVLRGYFVKKETIFHQPMSIQCSFVLQSAFPVPKHQDGDSENS